MLDVFLVSAKATLKIVLICGGGAYLQNIGILTKEVRKGLSEGFVKLLLPCLIFSRILPTISVQTLPMVAWLAIANLTYVTVGVVVGNIISCITQPAPHLYSILAITPAIGHANSIPFLLLPLICNEYKGFASGDATKAQAYISFYLIMHSITLWGVGLSTMKQKEAVQSGAAQQESKKLIGAPPQLLGSPAEGDEASGGSVQLSCQGDAESAAGPPAPVHAAVPKVPQHRKICDTMLGIFCHAFQLGNSHPAAPRMHGGASGLEAVEAETQEEAWAESVSSMDTCNVTPLPRQLRQRLSCKPDSLQSMLPKWMNRPVVTAMLAAVLGLFPAIKALLVSPDGALHLPFEAMEQLGATGNVLSLLTVGALFTADGIPKPWVIGYRPLAGVLLGRLVILPAICIPLWLLLREVLPFFPKENTFMLVMCIECCTPSAYNLVTMCVLQGRNPTDFAAALFYQNLMAIFTITLWVSVILYFVI